MGGRRVHVCFEPSSTLRRTLSAKLINRVRSSSLPSDFGAEVGEMRPGSLLLPLAAAASAVAASAGDVSEYVMVREEEAPPVSWTSVPARDKGLSSVDGVVESIGGALLRAAGAVTRTARSFTWSADDTSSRQRRSFATERDVSGTVYQVIRENDRGRLFSELLDGHESLRQMLDDPGREVTVFLPADDAMRRLEGPGAVDEASVREILEYHVLSGVYPLDALREARAAHTVLEEGGMGRRQRVRVEEGVEGVDVNFYARVSGGDSIQTANGIVHFVDDVLVPPPRHDKLIEALPERLSVFAEALRRTGMRPRGGVTVFAPSDDAWEALGAEAEGFLFSDEGEEYLRALVGYHVVEDAVVYSDTETLGEFESLLAGAGVVVKNGGTGKLVVDGAEVEVRDLPARDGVVHVLDRVLVPGGDRESGDGSMSVEEIRRRLGRFVRVDEGFESGEL